MKLFPPSRKIGGSSFDGNEGADETQSDRRSSRREEEKGERGFPDSQRKGGGGGFEVDPPPKRSITHDHHSRSCDQREKKTFDLKINYIFFERHRHSSIILEMITSASNKL